MTASEAHKAQEAHALPGVGQPGRWPDHRVDADRWPPAKAVAMAARRRWTVMRALGMTHADAVARRMDDFGRIAHGRASAGLSARVMTRDGRVGVVVSLRPQAVDGDGLLLGVVWLPQGQPSRIAADRVARAYRSGLRSAVTVPTRGLVALEAWLDPNRETCVHTDPFHLGYCIPHPNATDGADAADLDEATDGVPGGEAA